MKEIIKFQAKLSCISLQEPKINLDKLDKFGIIIMMVHYSSRTIYCEGGAKNPLKGIPMKHLICARNASFVCEQDERNQGMV